nr:hypothetical protein [Tanacetum cinerariifolium]
MMFAKARGKPTSLVYAKPTSLSAAARESAEHLTSSVAGSSNMTTTVDAVLSETSNSSLNLWTENSPSQDRKFHPFRVPMPSILTLHLKVEDWKDICFENGHDASRLLIYGFREVREVRLVCLILFMLLRAHDYDIGSSSS